jgi:hypothetical protein
MEYQANKLVATGMKFDEMLVPPPGLEEARRALAEQAKKRAKDAEESNRSEAQRK